MPEPRNVGIGNVPRFAEPDVAVVGIPTKHAPRVERYDYGRAVRQVLQAREEIVRSMVGIASTNRGLAEAWAADEAQTQRKAKAEEADLRRHQAAAERNDAMTLLTDFDYDSIRMEEGQTPSQAVDSTLLPMISAYLPETQQYIRSHVLEEYGRRNDAKAAMALKQGAYDESMGMTKRLDVARGAKDRNLAVDDFQSFYARARAAGLSHSEALAPLPSALASAGARGDLEQAQWLKRMADQHGLVDEGARAVAQATDNRRVLAEREKQAAKEEQQRILDEHVNGVYDKILTNRQSGPSGSDLLTFREGQIREIMAYNIPAEDKYKLIGHVDTYVNSRFVKDHDAIAALDQQIRDMREYGGTDEERAVLVANIKAVGARGGYGAGKDGANFEAQLVDAVNRGERVRLYRATETARQQFSRYATSTMTSGRPKFVNGSQLTVMFNQEMDEELRAHPGWDEADAAAAAAGKVVVFSELLRDEEAAAARLHEQHPNVQLPSEVEAAKEALEPAVPEPPKQGVWQKVKDALGEKPEEKPQRPPAKPGEPAMVRTPEGYTIDASPQGMANLSKQLAEGSPAPVRQPSGELTPGQPYPVRIMSDAEWEALAPGTVFIGPDNIPRRK
jgi:hypothetical protein